MIRVVKPQRAFRFSGVSDRAGRIVGIELKHSRNVAFIDTREDLRNLLRTRPEGFDGIITTNPSLIPGVTVADCMPIYLFCKTTGDLVFFIRLEGDRHFKNCSPRHDGEVSLQAKRYLSRFRAGNWSLLLCGRSGARRIVQARIWALFGARGNKRGGNALLH
jgi:hypothetical protein